MSHPKKGSLKRSRSHWTKPLPFLAAVALGGDIMLAHVDIRGFVFDLLIVGAVMALVFYVQGRGISKSPAIKRRSALSKLLPFVAAALGGVMMLISAARALSFYHAVEVAYGPPLHDTYVILPDGLRASLLIGLLVLMAGIASALVMRAQNRDTSHPGSHRDASKEKDVPNAVHAIFGFVSLFVPRRLANEELGDALEVINREIAKRRPRWRIWLKVGTTLFWITINSLRWVRGAFRGRRRFR